MADDDYSSERKKSKYEAQEPPPSERRYRNSQFPASERDTSHRSSRPSSSYRESERYTSREAYHSSRETYSSSRDSYQKPSREPAYSSSKESNHRENHSYKNRAHDSKSHNAKEEKKKLNAEERERLLREMQENAVWRDEQRKRNTQRYREEDEKEDRNRIDTSDFLKPMLSKAAGKGSLENRIKQKIFTIQRSSRDMDKNFARRD